MLSAREPPASLRRWRQSDANRFHASLNSRNPHETRIQEGKYALEWARLSCHRFDANQVGLQLFALAYNLGNSLRGLALPLSVKHWSLTTLRGKLIKIGVKIVQYARHVTFQGAEVAVPCQRFREILRRIGRLQRAPASLAPG